MEAILELCDVRLSFRSDGKVFPVLRGADLRLRQGETLAILGPGGSGKTLVLKILAGLIRPDSGSVLFRGRDLAAFSTSERLRFRRELGMTFQKSGLFDSLTCSENLGFPLRELLRLGPSERNARISKSLGEVGLSGQEQLMTHEMSGGMQKRLGIARALCLSPSLLLYDDPTAGLDPITSEAILDLILAMKRKYEMTIALVTSDPEQAFGIADRVGLLFDGRFSQVGTPEEIRGCEDPAVSQFIRGGYLERGNGS